MRSGQWWTRPVGALAALASVAMLFAACSTGGSDGSGDTGTSSTSNGTGTGTGTGTDMRTDTGPSTSTSTDTDTGPSTSTGGGAGDQSVNGPPAYTLAQAKRLLVTPAEAGLVGWKDKIPPGQQQSHTTLAIESLSRSVDSPFVDVSLVISNNTVNAHIVSVESRLLAKEDLTGVTTKTVHLATAGSSTSATEVRGTDKELKRPQTGIVFVIGPTTVSVAGPAAPVVEQIARAQARKLAAAR